MKYIPLSKGFVAIVDDQDYEWLNRFKWYAHQVMGSKRNAHYACRKRRKEETDNWRKNISVSMHREIMKPPKGMDTDHINGNRLDNRRENLRVVTHMQNMWNCRTRFNSKTGYRGVSFDAQTKHWRAVISVNKKYINLGRFAEIEDAISARQQAEKRYFSL